MECRRSYRTATSSITPPSRSTSVSIRRSKATRSFAPEISKYANAKGNLRFPLAEPIPYALIGRIVQSAGARESGRG